MDFGKRIKHLREEKNVSATQLAFHIGKGESAVRMWEIGRSKPDADTLIKIADFFDCTTDYLLGLSNYRTPAEELEYVSKTNETNQSLMNDVDYINFLRESTRKLSELSPDEREELYELIKLHLAQDISLADRKILTKANKGLVSVFNTSQPHHQESSSDGA